MEAKTQARLIKYLRSKGAYVIKPRGGPGVPIGCPDVIFLHPALAGTIEVKATEKSPYRQNQKETLARIKAMGYYSNTAHANNIDEIEAELDTLLVGDRKAV